MAIQNQSREQIHAWIKEFHKAHDSLRTADLKNFYAIDATLVFANNEPIFGLQNIVKFFDEIFPLLESMKHEIDSWDVVQNTIYLRSPITYVVKHDPKKEKFEIPALGVFSLVPEAENNEGVIKRFEVYIDLGPVYKRMGEVAEGKN